MVAVGDYVVLGEQPGKITKCEAGKIADMVSEVHLQGKALSILGFYIRIIAFCERHLPPF